MQKYWKLFKKWQKNDKKWRCFHKNNMFATCKIVIFLGGHFLVILWIFCHFLSFWGNLVKNIEKYQKLFEKSQKKGQNNDNVSRKMSFLHLAKLSFFCHFLAQFLSRIWKYSQKMTVFREKMTMFREKCNFCNLQNDKKTNKTTPKLTKKMAQTRQSKWQTKLTWHKNDKQNDKQNWHDKKLTNKVTDKIEMTKKMTNKWQKMTTKTTKKCQIRYLFFSTFACLFFFLTLAHLFFFIASQAETAQLPIPNIDAT